MEISERPAHLRLNLKKKENTKDSNAASTINDKPTSPKPAETRKKSDPFGGARPVATKVYNFKFLFLFFNLINLLHFNRMKLLLKM